MPLGICKLCLQQKQIRRSHYLGAFLYRLSRQPGKGNPNPIVMTRNVAVPTSNQMRDYLLCDECERRFSEHGENWIARHVYNGRAFPLLDRLNVAVPLYATPRLQIFSGTDVGIDTGRLAYFALSLVWRASVHQWLMPDGRTTSIDLGVYQEPIRRFLLGETEFPSHVVIVATACTDLVSQGTVFPPSAVLENPLTVFSCLVRGIGFRVLVGSDLPPEIRETCCLASAKKLIFAADNADKSAHAWSHLFSTAVPSRSLRCPQARPLQAGRRSLLASTTQRPSLV
jgi:hypothetical protein